MKKRIIGYGCLGMMIGIAFSFLIPLIISWTLQDGNFYPCTPALLQAMDNELAAVTLQTFISAILGFLCSLGGLVYRIEHWSLLKQSIVSCIIISTTTTVTAYICFWVPRTFEDLAGYILRLIGIYIMIWIAQYIQIRKHIKDMNHSITVEK